VVEQGMHHALMMKKGLYYSMYEQQKEESGRSSYEKLGNEEKREISGATGARQF
jgi:hypothetical protein